MVFSRNDRILIQELRIHKGYSAKELVREFPRKNWILSSVYKLIKKIDEHGSAERLKGSGRPRSARTKPLSKATRGSTCRIMRPLTGRVVPSIFCTKTARILSDPNTGPRIRRTLIRLTIRYGKFWRTVYTTRAAFLKMSTN